MPDATNRLTSRLTSLVLTPRRSPDSPSEGTCCVYCSNDLLLCVPMAGAQPCAMMVRARTHARAHTLHARTHARLARTHTLRARRHTCTHAPFHARLACTHALHARTPSMHAQRPCTHALHARLACTHTVSTHARTPCTRTLHARTHALQARTPFTHARLHARLACTHALHVRTPSMYAHRPCTHANAPSTHAPRALTHTSITPAYQRVLKHGTVMRNHLIIIDYYCCFHLRADFSVRGRRVLSEEFSNLFLLGHGGGMCC